MKKQLKPGKDYRLQFICKKKGVIKTNDLNDSDGLIIHDKDGIPAWQEFYSNGKLAYKSYWKDNKLHNLEVASCVEYNKKGEIINEYYYIEGKEYTKEDWEQKVKELKNNKIMKNLQPLSDRVLIKPETTETKTSSGIIIPDSAKEKPQKGEVIAVGEETSEIKKGDTVLYGKYSGTELAFDKKNYLMMREIDIMAIVSRGV